MIVEHIFRMRAVVKVRRSSFATVATVAVVAIVLGTASRARAGEDKEPPQAAPKTPPVSAKLTDVAWIQGHWSTKFDENELHEIWSPPSGDCMMASFCWIKSGKVWMYEFMTMVEEDGSVVLRFKHFSRALHGWEEKDVALTLALVELDENLAAFKNVTDSGPTWLIFQRVSPTRLTVAVNSEREGGEGSFEIKYERVK